MGNVNLKYLIRIRFLEKHELGSVYERCWRVWHPCSLTPFLTATSAIWFRNWFARERQSGVGEGSVSECGSLDSELASLRQSRQGHVASRHLTTEEY